MCEGIHIHICKESDTTEHAHKGIKHACTCVRVRAHTRNLPGKDGLTCEIHTLSSFQDLSGGNSEIKVFCHPGWSDEILGIGRNVLKKLKSLLNLALERVYEVQSGKHFQM